MKILLIEDEPSLLAAKLYYLEGRNQALPQSTGLGLALMKEIAGRYGMTVKYDYASSMRRHLFQVYF